MRRFAAVLLFAGACARPEGPGFTLSFAGAATARERAEAARLGVGFVPVPGAREEPAFETEHDGRQTVSPASRLRLQFARAVVRGEPGLTLILPGVAAGHDLLDFPEEWLALARLAREAAALAPVLRSGPGVPLRVGGVEGRSWKRAGREYRLFVNDAAEPLVLPRAELKRARALFETRADPRELLISCGDAECLPPGRALWVEGRP